MMANKQRSPHFAPLEHFPQERGQKSNHLVSYKQIYTEVLLKSRDRPKKKYFNQQMTDHKYQKGLMNSQLTAAASNTCCKL